MKDRDFNSEKLNYIANLLKDRTIKMEYQGDLSDCGNEIGIVIGSTYAYLTEDEISDLISGIKHGISLTNGTH